MSGIKDLKKETPPTLTLDAIPEINSVDPEKGVEAPDTPNYPYLVKFTTPYDASNPKDWSVIRKWAVTTVLSTTGFNRIMVSTIMAPALSTIAFDLNMSDIEAVMSMSVYVLATAFGPLIIGPLSELYGRKPVLHATNVWFLVWNIVCGFAQYKGTLISARLFAGLGASAIYALGSGVMGDVWRPEQRGRSLGLYMLIPLCAAAVGPIVGGYITEYTTWRWMFWSTSILQGIMVIVAFCYYHETHAPTILRQTAARLRKDTGDEQYVTEGERMHLNRSVAWIIHRNLTRPIQLLLFHPIIQINACLSGFGYGLLYLVLSSFSSLWTTQYHESISTSSLYYLAIVLGEIIGAQILGPLLDLVWKHQVLRTGHPAPEFRLPLMIPGTVLVPLGLFLYGWAAEYHTPWIVVDIGAFIMLLGSQMSGQALQAYVIDSYPDHTSSASAASQFLRGLAAFGFPLFAPRMYEMLGYGWGNSTLAFVQLAIGIPAPIFLWVYGARLRARAKSSY